MACPFFIPTDRVNDLALPHPARLPLGASWRGTCAAPGHEQATPSSVELESCNLGYAKSCPRLPKERSCDSVRFAVASDSGTKISLQFVLEAAHLPVEYGSLEYDQLSHSWMSRHSQAGIQKLAECFMQSYLERKAPRPSA
jgi:hypothetical protein